MMEDTHESIERDQTEQTQRYRQENLRLSLNAVRSYVQIGTETLVCVVAIAGSVYASSIDKDTLAYVLASVPILSLLKSLMNRS